MGSMTHHDEHDDLQHVVARLRAERPEATPLKLDAVKQRVVARAARPRSTTRRSTPLMRTRAAILSVLALGFLLSTAGAGLAVTGLQDNSQASQAQYPAPQPPPTPAAPAPIPESQVLGEQQESAPAKPAAPEENKVLPEKAESPAAAPAPAPAPVQATRQVEVGAQAGSLPFTGFAALPILLLGLALLSIGLVMRRSTGKQ
jgi:hypothetical protein